MDNVIQSTIILLILSLITEKITNLLKLHSELAVSKDSKEEELKRESKIQLLSFLIGILVALFCKANIFLFFKPDFSLFWESKDFVGHIYISNILGSIFTGLFLSLGSKFFHDLLDVLLQVKNLKRKLNDKEDWDFQDISKFDEYINVNEKKRFETFVTEQLKPYNISAIDVIDYDKSEVLVITDKPEVTLPGQLFYKTSIGKVEIITIKRQISLIKTLNSNIFPSIEISNEDPTPTHLQGSLTYLVKGLNNKQYLLTCFHAVWHSTHDWDYFVNTGNEQVIEVSTKNEIGKIERAVRNSEIDVALIVPDPNINFNMKIENIGDIRLSREINDQDVESKRGVKMYGGFSGQSDGYIAGINRKAKIKYPDGKYWELSNLILIKSNNKNPFSMGGDSGSLIVDEFDYAIGVLVAGDEAKLSFAIPFNVIEKQLNIKI
jgi:hypothetical protein